MQTDDDIKQELIQREPLFHHPDKFGSTEEDLLNMTCDDFYEVGASGTIFTRQDVIEELLKRYTDPAYTEELEAKDFQVTKIATDNYLVTYTLFQGYPWVDKDQPHRVTRRATVWRYEDKTWKILYHQGTVV